MVSTWFLILFFNQSSENISFRFMHCGNHENVPLRPPGVKSIMDCWPQLLPLWIQHCICCQALLPMACSQAVTKHTAGKLASQARCRVPLKEDFSLRTLWAWPNLSWNYSGVCDVGLSFLPSLISQASDLHYGMKAPSAFFCSVPNTYFVHLIPCWRSFLSRPGQCISRLDLTLFTDTGRQLYNNGEKIW